MQFRMKKPVVRKLIWLPFLIILTTWVINKAWSNEISFYYHQIKNGSVIEMKGYSLLLNERFSLLKVGDKGNYLLSRFGGNENVISIEEHKHEHKHGDAESKSSIGSLGYYKALDSLKESCQVFFKIPKNDFEEESHYVYLFSDSKLALNVWIDINVKLAAQEHLEFCNAISIKNDDS